MKIGYFLSIMLILQSTTSIHAMAGRVCNLLRNSSMLLPTLTNHTAPLFARSLHATKNISLPSYRLFQQKPRPQSFNRNFLTATAGLGLWGHNRLNSMTVHAQEEELECSKEVTSLSYQFSTYLKKDNLKEAQASLFNMANNLKNKDDYLVLAYHTNEFLKKAESALIYAALDEKKETAEQSIKMHIMRILMANGMIKSIQESERLTIPETYWNLFSAVKKSNLIKKIYLDEISQLESDIIYDNTKNAPTAHNKILLKILNTIKAILNGEIE